MANVNQLRRNQLSDLYTKTRNKNNYDSQQPTATTGGRIHGKGILRMLRELTCC